MNKRLFIILPLSIILACGTAENQAESESKWTPEQEQHFVKDCSEKLLANRETEDNTRALCACLLDRLKDTFTNGKEAMNKITDEQIVQMEQECKTW